MNNKDTFIASAAVTGKKQITLPKEVYDLLGLKNNDRVAFTEKDGEIIIKKEPMLKDFKIMQSSPTTFNLIIPYYMLSDAITMQELHIAEQIFNLGEDFIKKGGRVIVQKEYTNSPPQVMRTYDNITDFLEMKEKMLSIDKLI